MRHIIVGPSANHAQHHIDNMPTQFGDSFVIATDPEWVRGQLTLDDFDDHVIVCTDLPEFRNAILAASRAGAIEVERCGLPVHGLKMREHVGPGGVLRLPRIEFNYQPISNADLANRFTHHPPSAEQIPVFEQIRAEGHGLAQFIKDNTPPSPEQYRAIEAVETAVMLANAALARHGSDS